MQHEGSDASSVVDAKPAHSAASTSPTLSRPEICQKLSDAQSLASKQRWRIRGGCMSIGLSLLLTSFVPSTLGWGAFVSACFTPLTAFGGLVCLAAVLPTDRRAIRLTALLFAAVSLFYVVVAGTLALDGLSAPPADWQSTVQVAERSWLSMTSAAAAVVFVHSALRLAPRDALDRLWVGCFLLGLAAFFGNLRGLVMGSVGALGPVLSGLSLMAACGSKKFRHELHARLSRFSESAQASIAVAGLLNGLSGREVIAMARKCFRGVSCELITAIDMADNKPNPALAALSTLRPLGMVDAFLTHSWSDCAAAKFQAMQEWRSEFKSRMRREPMLWIDKYCIDQNNINASLQCLPVFLARCTQVWMAIGETYLTRLWCTLEVFTFLQMGGSASSVLIRTLNGFDPSRTDFKAENARCYDPNDRDRILAIIDAAFGHLERFNRSVECLLQESGMLTTHHSSAVPIAVEIHGSEAAGDGLKPGSRDVDTAALANQIEQHSGSRFTESADATDAKDFTVMDCPTEETWLAI